MSTNQTSLNTATNEEKAIYRSMLRATWLAAFSALFTLIIAVAFGSYSLWQTSQLLQRSSAGEEIHAIDVSPAEILESLRLGEQAAMTATANLVQPDEMHLLLLDSGDLPIASAGELPPGVAGITLDSSMSNQGLSIMADGQVADSQIVPVAAPIAIQAGNTTVLYLRLPSPAADQPGAAFDLESADYSSAAATTSISPTQAIEVADARPDEQAGQNFTISLTTTKGSKAITIIVWNNY
jgi:hypothetical protein